MSCGHEIALAATTSRSSRTSSCAGAAAVPGADPVALPGGGARYRRCSSPACVIEFGLDPRRSPPAFFSSLVAISATDIEHRIVPNRIVLPAGGGRSRRADWRRIRARVGGRRLRRRRLPLRWPRSPAARMGMGDVKLALVLGAVLGGRAGRDARRHARGDGAGDRPLHPPRCGARKMKIPFGPFLALGAVVALFAGQRARSTGTQLSSLAGVANASSLRRRADTSFEAHGRPRHC